MKPNALTDAQLAEIEDRIIRGWVVRRDQWVALLAMARERNMMVSTYGDAQAAASQSATVVF